MSDARHLGTLMVSLLFAALSVMSTHAVWSGVWPRNHESSAFIRRVAVYATHYQAGDLLPVWSSIDNAGLGSAEPALYHKLFYVIAGCIAAVTGQPGRAAAIAVAIFLTVGALGEYLLIQRISGSRAGAAAGGVMLVVANYTVTDWMIRGAVAEFSAGMLVPWLLLLLLGHIREPRRSAGIGTVLGLLLMAHTVMFAYISAICAVAVAVALVNEGRLRASLPGLKSIARIAAFGLLVAGPSIVAVLVMGHGYDMSRIVPTRYLPEHRLAPISLYFWDPNLRIGRDWRRVPLQLDIAVYGLLAVALVGGVARLARSRLHTRTQRPVAAGRRWPTDVTALLVLVLICLLLQMSIAVAFYRLPGAAYLQFPWRLLALMTPALIALAVRLATTTTGGRLRAVVLLAATAVSISCSGAFRTIEYGNSTPAGTDRMPPVATTFSGFGEYVPVAAGLPAPTMAAVAQQALARGCTIRRLGPFVESLRVEYRFRCAHAAAVPLPEIWGPGYAACVREHAAGCVEIRVTDASRGLIGVRLPGGAGSISLERPTLWRALVAMTDNQG